MKDTAHLRPVDRVLLLQSSPLLANATAAQLWRLSALAREATVAAGAEAFPKGSEAAILIVLSGSLAVEGAGVEGTATAGDVIGMYETLAGSALGASVKAVKESRVLRIDRGGLFELLADHTDLLQGIFSMLLRRLGQDDFEHRLDTLTAAHADACRRGVRRSPSRSKSQSGSAGMQARLIRLVETIEDVRQVLRQECPRRYRSRSA